VQAFGEDIAQRLLQIGAHGAAQATVVQQRHALGGSFQQLVVDRLLAELVHDDGGIVHPRMAQKLLQQRGLAAAKEAGDDADGDAAGEGVAAGRRGWSVCHEPTLQCARKPHLPDSLHRSGVRR
jgi:hypothetical protein